MADLRVKLFLDLVNRTKAGAEAAKRDLASVKATAEQLRRARAGDALRRDLARAAKEARVARDALAGTVAEGRRLARTGPGQTLRRDLAAAAREAKLARRALAETASEAQKLARNGPGQALRRDLAAAAREARLARQALAGTVAEGQRLARVGPGQVLRRDLARIALEARRAKDELRGLNREANVPKKSGRGPSRQAAGRQRNGAQAAEAPGGAGFVAAGRGAIAAAGGYMAARGAVRGTVGNSVSFESAMADVKRKVDLPPGQNWQDLERTIVANAIAFGRAREEVAALVAEAGAAGIAYEDLTEYTKLSTKAAVAWDMGAQATSQSLAEIRAATGWTIPQLQEFVDKVNWLGDNSAAKEADIVEMFQRAGAAAEAANVPFDVTLTSLTALRSIGMREEVSARFFNAFASRLRTATHLPKKAAAGFKMLGTSAEAVEAAMKVDPVQAMVDVLTRLEQAPDKAAAAIKIFGQEWWDEAARMGKALPEMLRLLEGLANGSNWKGSSQKAIEIELSTTANHLERLKTLATEVGDRLGRWTLPGINAQVQSLVDLFNDLETRANILERREAEKQGAEQAGAPSDSGTSLPDLVLHPEKPINELEKSIAEAVTGERKLFTEIIGDWLFGKKGQKDQQLEDARQSGFAEARARLYEGEQQAIDRAEELRKRNDASGQGKVVFDPNSGRYMAREVASAELEHAEEVARRAQQARAARENSDRQASQTADQRQAWWNGPRFGLTGPTPGALDSTGIAPIKPIDIRQWINPTVDLGPTIMQQLAASIDAGRGQVEGSARQAGDGIRAALSGVDLSGQGQAIMGSLAAGIAQGGERAVAEAQRVASRVRGAMAGVGGGRGGDAGLSGALHDGVTEN